MISKEKSSKNGNYFFSFKSNVAVSRSSPCEFITNEFVVLPETDTPEWNELFDQVKHIFINIVSFAKRDFDEEEIMDKNLLGYKCVFSDKFILTGKANSTDFNSHKRFETHKSFILPMSEKDCDFIFQCVPY